MPRAPVAEMVQVATSRRVKAARSHTMLPKAVGGDASNRDRARTQSSADVDHRFVGHRPLLISAPRPQLVAAVSAVALALCSDVRRLPTSVSERMPKKIGPVCPLI